MDEFAVDRDLVMRDVRPDYNVAPTDPIFTVLARAGRDRPGAAPAARELRLLRWGLVPFWARDRCGARPINARAETVAVKPLFRGAFARRRCLIPADGYYEWCALGGRERGRPRKQPYFIHRADGRGMAFAGIYELWRDRNLPDGDPAARLWTAAIITTSAAGDAGWVHDRMPMVVSPGHWDEWLDPATAGADRLLRVITPAASDALAARPVSAAVNKVGNNGPELLTPLAESAPGDA